MKYKIVSLNESKFSDLIEKLKKFLDKTGTFSENDFHYLFVFGGDGTLINYIKKYAFENKKIIGIKGGTVSFLNEKIENFSSFLNENSFTNIELLKIKINSDTYYAFNDFFISGNSFLKAKIFVNENFFKDFRGSGLLFSTKIGSTGQNKSFSGPIICPSIDAWLMNSVGEQLTYKFSALNSPIIFSPKEKIAVQVLQSNCIFYIDGKKVESFFDNLEIELVKANSSFLFPKDTENYLKKLFINFLSKE